MNNQLVILAVVLSAAASAPSAGVPARTGTRVAVRTVASGAIDDPRIVAIFDAANTWDVETSEVAMARSKNPIVRDFAAMMIRDHKAVRQLGRDLAKKLNVTPTPPGKDFPLTVDHAASMKKLRGATGKAFDKAYMDHEIWYHQAVIDAVTTQLLPATTNDELKALETKVAPNFVAHLAAAKDIRAKLQSGLRLIRAA